MIKPIPEHNSMRGIAYSLKHMILKSIEQFTSEKKLGQPISSFAKMAETSKRKDFLNLS